MLKEETQARSEGAHLDADLTRAHVAALQAELAHSSQGELPQVSLLHTARDQRHGNVSLDAVHPHPRRYQRKQPRHLSQ